MSGCRLVQTGKRRSEACARVKSRRAPRHKIPGPDLKARPVSGGPCQLDLWLPPADSRARQETTPSIPSTPTSLLRDWPTVGKEWRGPNAVRGFVPRTEEEGGLGPAEGETAPVPPPGPREEGESAIRLYLREIARVPLLTPQQEVALAARIKRGDAAARDLMIRANLRLVVKIAHDYEGLGLPLLDMINEGNLGLMRGVERFDPAKGGKLSTYAAWWIKQSIKRAIANQGKTIRLPVHLVDKIGRMKRIAHHLQELLGREPTDAEVAEHLGVSPERVALLRNASIRPASLDAPIAEGEAGTIGELVEDDRAEDPYEHLNEKTMGRIVDDLVERLPDREKTIVCARFGLHGTRVRTLEEIGQGLGVTRERIRQLQNVALKKLRRMIEKLERQRD
ncbi:MAG: sigma-70 family RNA polymerase sigma factor [Verrucomicrobia bacterium]|nr:sigma-70 family RNA polymerase sigma factor [Verrucomicrobiota bacterium]